MIRFACDLAVVCGVSLRHMALLFAALCLMPMTKSAMKRWIDAIGSPLPTPEQMLQHLLARPRRRRVILTAPPRWARTTV